MQIVMIIKGNPYSVQACLSLIIADAPVMKDKQSLCFKRSTYSVFTHLNSFLDAASSPGESAKAACATV